MDTSLRSLDTISLSTTKACEYHWLYYHLLLGIPLDWHLGDLSRKVSLVRWYFPPTKLLMHHIDAKHSLIYQRPRILKVAEMTESIPIYSWYVRTYVLCWRGR